MRGIFALGLLAGANTVSASAIAAQPRQDLDQRPWVTVSADGAVATVLPSAGGSSFSGSVDKPTAAADGSGSFLVCSPASGENRIAPFCAPFHNSTVQLDKTYFITWDATWFEFRGGMARLMAEYSDTDEGMGGREAFLTEQIPTDQGYYAWTVNRTQVPEVPVTSVGFYFQFERENKNEETTITDMAPGPRLWIMRDDIDEDAPGSGNGGSGGGKKSNTTAIAVGVVVGIVSLGLVGFGVWWFGKRKGWFGGAAGYGVRKSLGQRSQGAPAANPTANIKLQEGRWSDQGVPTSPNSQNVFREELKRQERENQ